jgi:DNA repair exonuclease SbcCD ATPase subunit
MQERLQQRLQALKNEYEAGQRMMAELDAKQVALRDTLLRISGAIQVLEEALGEAEATYSTTEPSDTAEAKIIQATDE